MTGLFLRFYLGVLVILVSAWAVHVFLSRPPTDDLNAEVIEQAMGGGIRMACQAMEDASSEDQAAAFARVRGQFDFPVAKLAPEDLPSDVRRRLSRGDDVIMLVRDQKIFLVGRMDHRPDVLLFGPMPRLVGPSHGEVTLGLAFVLLLAAMAILVLLRPVARQLRMLEQTAAAFAAGTLSARVNEDQAGALLPLAQAFNGMAQQTETLLRTQRELMQAVSHELRTPLSRIQFAIELIREESDPARLPERLDVMVAGAEELDQMVAKLLQYVRAEATQPTAPRWQVPLEPIISEIFEKETWLHPNFKFEIDPYIIKHDVCVLTSANDLTCVLTNTIRNAVRFAKSTIRVSAYRTSKGVVMDIDDDGPGIEPRLRKRVFQPFERLGDYGGNAGLGLALVGRILVQHGGWAKVETSPLGGCRLRTFWPRRSSTDKKVN